MMTTSTLRVCVLAVMLGLGCTGSGEEPSLEEESSLDPIGEECDPLDLECITGGLDGQQKVDLDRLGQAAAGTSIEIEGVVDGNWLALTYFDHRFNRWFEVQLRSYGDEDGIASRYVYDDNNIPVLYYDKSVSPVAGNSWAWADYSIVAGVIGLPHDADLQYHLDAAAGRAVTSPVGVQGVQAIAALQASDLGVASTCTEMCNRSASQISWWGGLATGIGCALAAAVTAPSIVIPGLVGLACGTIGKIGLSAGVDATACWNKCVDCYYITEDVCSEDNVTPGYCLDMPWRCDDGKVIIPTTQRIGI
jgi:hypothetical protein